jgi:hypothetical protein
MCNPKRCRAARLDAVADPPPSGSVSERVADFVEGLSLPVGDVRRVFVPMAEVLAAAIDGGNRSQFAFTELRAVLRDLAADPATGMTDLKVARHQRRIDAFLPLTGGLS